MGSERDEAKGAENAANTITWKQEVGIFCSKSLLLGRGNALVETQFGSPASCDVVDRFRHRCAEEMR
jgi:hypothetical protein